ncbi:MAG: glycerol-3-phosphate 1-O-acyltransferase PlsY [Kiritimatiellales bacterium]|nr:glycerol-3-phosphate 1-O-acyltransferase PlsY [Kiritimatiellales bacterium]
MGIVVFTGLAYLLGSVPFGLLIARSRGVDIRRAGSGNIGATNVFRCVGKGWGVCAFVLDALKGFVPAFVFPIIGKLDESIAVEAGLLFGAAAIIGHSFPVFLRFKGGKGVATSAGMLLGVAPVAVAAGFACWLICVLITRYVSLASILAALAVAVSGWVVYHDSLAVSVALTAIALLIIWRHRANIGRLLKGTEHRFGKKKEAGAL